MKCVKINLKNCYGIKKLDVDLDFSGKRVFAIYAPNGVMKSSLAKTFLDAANGSPSVDRIFQGRETSRSIIDEAGAQIEGERILVVLPYNEQFAPTEKTSTLLVDPALRKEYSQLHVAIDEAKSLLLAALKQQTGSKIDFGKEISAAFTSSSDEFQTAVIRIQKEVEGQKDTPFAKVDYDTVFDPKVQSALSEKDLKDAIEEYIRRYNELLAASTYFKKGTFDYYNAGQIAKSLADNGFFLASHTVRLKGTDKVLEITNQKELEAVIAGEKDAIIGDPQLRKTFDKVAKKLEKNAELRTFCKYLQDNEPILSRMNNLNKFKEDVLKSYLKVHEHLYLDLMAKYEAAAKRKKEIEEEAKKQRTQWEEVIGIFNDRFFVPFKLEAKNRTAVILGDDAIIDLGFTYIDGAETAVVDKPQLLQALSTGERKALYVLNVIFEIQTRIKNQQETLIVVDDLADSFDYQNKYAIIQYLKDISDEGLFAQIIMTHNFDFFRTLESRFVGYGNCLMATKLETGVVLSKASGIKNIFVNDLKKGFFSDPRKKIASIPFLRNLVEFTKGGDDANYKKLTSLLHWKADTSSITVGDLDSVHNAICGTAGASADPGKPVSVLIEEAAQGCLAAPGGATNLESKIILAIAIRLAAERFIIAKLNDDKLVSTIEENQTQVLISAFKKKFPDERATIKVLDQVALMTPENIHVNSFMYEPIVDMSDDHLRKLYERALALK